MKHKPLAEMTLRKYEKPFRLTGRELVKKLCLSIGILQPGDSRDVVVDVFMSLLSSKEPLDASQIEQKTIETRLTHNISTIGATSSNIRRQIRRLKESHLVEKTGIAYRLTENMPLHEIFTERIEKFYLPEIVSRVKEYCEAVERWKNGHVMPEMQKPND